jgi:hypothetical protein
VLTRLPQSCSYCLVPGPPPCPRPPSVTSCRRASTWAASACHPPTVPDVRPPAVAPCPAEGRDSSHHDPSRALDRTTTTCRALKGQGEGRALWLTSTAWVARSSAACRQKTTNQGASQASRGAQQD